MENVRLTQRIMLITGRWGTTTPFGVPVLPEVKITYAESSAVPTAGTGLGSCPSISSQDSTESPSDTSHPGPSQHTTWDSESTLSRESRHGSNSDWISRYRTPSAVRITCRRAGGVAGSSGT